MACGKRKIDKTQLDGRAARGTTMNWLQRLEEPLGKTREEAEAYLTTELERSVPRGWTVGRGDGTTQRWVITRQEIPSGEWSSQEYGVQLAGSLDYLVFTHGNNDIGGWGLHQALQNALVIEAAALRHFGMAACLQYLMSHYRPNEWGYT
jgi:hypothetical protein